MVLVEKNYRPPLLLRNGHVHTIYASKYRSTECPSYVRERWTTPDNDFLDIDLYLQNSKNLIIIGHGLEGSSKRPYVSGLANIFLSQDYDICAWNCRSCSGEMNKKARLYNHGEIEDIDLVVHKMLERNQYTNVVLAGFSMGGAIIMNWLGSKQNQIPKQVKAGIAISAPCDIKEASLRLESGIHKIYKNYFMKKLSEKIIAKAKQFPGWLDIKGIEKIKTWREFDERFSAPLGHYEDAEDFYFHCSAIHRLDKISIPLLLLNSKDDPILTPASYPIESIKNNELITGLYTEKGGHVAFMESGQKITRAEQYTYQFAEAIINKSLNQFHKQFEKL